MSRLAGKTALITGAARGLGAAIAQRFAEAGARVIINDLHLEQAEAQAKALDGFAVSGDVSSSAAVASMFEAVRKHTDQLDILVNNAGISGLEGDNEARARIARMAELATRAAQGEEVDPKDLLLSSLLDEGDDTWQRMMGIHVNGTFYCSREAMRMMLPRNTDGAIINMGSVMGTFGRGGGTAYCTAKAAILGFTRALAHETATQNLRVNAIAPGWITTDMTDPLAPMHPMLEAQTPQGRLGEPDDIAYAAVYLASEEAKFVTGQTLSPNGGWYMSQ
ncbi:MAG: SDR family NAD(P)-dependent oxidoreductase [Pseudomonadales bacterium]